jgi:dCMP deaminase
MMNTPKIPSWDERFMRDVYEWASKSKDPMTKIGAVILHWDEKDPISHGYNGIVRRVRDDVPERWERPEKYFWMSHAERNAIYNCARRGRASEGTTLFTQGIPCCDCADGVIQAGITEVVVHKQWQHYEKEFNWKKWQDSATRSQTKFLEAGIRIRVFDGKIGSHGFLDGKIIDV